MQVSSPGTEASLGCVTPAPCVQPAQQPLQLQLASLPLSTLIGCLLLGLRSSHLGLGGLVPAPTTGSYKQAPQSVQGRV